MYVHVLRRCPPSSLLGNCNCLRNNLQKRPATRDAPFITVLCICKLTSLASQEEIGGLRGGGKILRWLAGSINEAGGRGGGRGERVSFTSGLGFNNYTLLTCTIRPWTRRAFGKSLPSFLPSHLGCAVGRVNQMTPPERTNGTPKPASFGQGRRRRQGRWRIRDPSYTQLLFSTSQLALEKDELKENPP